MAATAPKTKNKSIEIYDQELTDEIQDIHERVSECYRNLEKDDIKFTHDMIALIEIDFINHSHCKLSEIDNIKDFNDITKRYLQECKKRLTDYNPVKVKNNLKEMGLI